MASIFSRSNNRAFVKQLQEQAKKVKKAEPTIKKGGSLITKIQNIEKLVQERLGHYAKELELIQTPQRLHEYIDECINNGIIAIDTETTGLDPITDKIVGACIYTYGQKAAYIPINHISYITNIRLQEQLSEQQVAEEFQRLVDNNTKIIMFNAKFDIRVIRHQLGVYMIPAWCGFIAGKCLKNNEEESNLKYLWKKYCSQNKEEAHFTFDKMFEGLRFDLVPMNTAYLYAAKDALMTLDLYDYQKPLLTEDDPKCIENDFQKLAKLYREIELPIIPIVADIEDQGVCIDTEYAQQLSIKYNEKLKKAEDAFHKELEKYQDQITSYVNTHPNTKIENPINIGSPTQLAELFYDILQVPAVSRKSPRGTGEEILEKMGHPLGKLILDYRGIAKLLNTYIDKLPATLNKKTHKIHCSFNSYGTDCLYEQSHLVTNKGVFTLKELFSGICKNNAEFYDVDLNILNKDLKWEQATKAIKYENVNTIKVKGLYGFELQGTPNHPVMVSRITQNQLSKNRSAKQLREFWYGKYFKKLDQLQVGDFIEIPCVWDWPYVDFVPTNFTCNVLKTHNKQQLKYPQYYDEQFAEFLGIYHADGHYSNTKNGFCITISNQDMDVYNRLVYLCKNLFNVIPKREDNGNKEVNIRIRLTHLRCLQTCLNKGALNKRIPEQIRHSNEKVIKAYLKGMTLDSCRSKNKFLITVRNKIDAQFIQMFLCSQGILSAVRDSSYKYKGVHREMYRIALNATNLNLFLDKIGVVQENKNIKEEKENTRYKYIKIGSSFKIEVKSIEYCKSTVYDIHVPKTHSFICNSAINHNTGRFSSSSPNLQNIPSHNTDIRPMFVASKYVDIESKDNILQFLIQDEVQTLQGWKNVEELQAGDIIMCDDGNHTVKNIEVQEKEVNVII